MAVVVMMVTLSLLGISTGLSIDIVEKETSDCLHPSVMIKCMSKTDELTDGNKKLIITHGGLKQASCDWATGMCEAASTRYNASIEGTTAVLMVKNMDVYYESNAWACDVGTKTASLKLKYFRAETETFAGHFVSPRNISIVDLATLIIVIVILVVLIIHVFCRDCCKTNRDSSKTDAESGFCLNCLLCCGKKREPVKTGYQGKKYDVRTSYNIEDPNHVPDARFKGGPDRKTEAADVCKNVTEKDKEIIKENLIEYTEARKPLISTTSEGDSKM